MLFCLPAYRSAAVAGTVPLEVDSLSAVVVFGISGLDWTLRELSHLYRLV